VNKVINRPLAKKFIFYLYLVYGKYRAIIYNKIMESFPTNRKKNKGEVIIEIKEENSDAA
jgi:hypothetical protein